METTIDINIDEADQESWVDLCNHSDIFYPHTCGYWLYGVTHDKRLGWLVYEMGDERHPEKSLENEASSLWRCGEKLPEGFMRFDKGAMCKAYAEGVKRGGTDWQTNADVSDMDIIIQLALLGSITYG